MNLADDLQKLHNLREQGALTEEEFTLAKKRLLEGAAEDAKPKTEKSREPASALNQFRRSNTDRWIGGVCGGLGEITGIPSWSWRILFVLTALLHGIGVIMYVLLWIFVPLQTNTPQPVTPLRE
jgi:phage shock protein C